MEKAFDIVIFGASGYTGQFVLDEVARTSCPRAGFRWAIAGRNEQKLMKLLQEAELRTGTKLVSTVSILKADIEDESSLELMARKCQVILNCVGPYHFYGERVVKACIANNCHMLDISGEPEYLESVQLNYNDQAKEKGVYVIGSCGFDSAVAELGVHYTEKQFDGILNQVESYLKANADKNFKIHYATWQSLLHGITNRNELRSLRKNLYQTKLPPLIPKQATKGPIFFSEEVGSWCIPFLGSDKSVVYRSQRFLHEYAGKKRMLQFVPYFCASSFMFALLLLFYGVLLGLLASWKTTRRLLERYPRLFTAGYVSHEGATREQIDKSSFKMTFVGRGWSSDRVDEPNPDAEIVTQVVGPEPGYITCSMCMVQAGYILLDEVEKLPKSGGVYSPDAAFRGTSYLERMQQKLEFTTVKRSSIEKST